MLGFELSIDSIAIPPARFWCHQGVRDEHRKKAVARIPRPGLTAIGNFIGF